MVRRLATSLMLLACLFGIVRPALACASSANCCQFGCTEQTQLGSGSAALEGCCVTQAAAGALPSSSPPARYALDAGAGGTAAVIASAEDFQILPRHEIGAARLAIRVATDQSFTYLLTARLRL